MACNSDSNSELERKRGEGEDREEERRSGKSREREEEKRSGEGKEREEERRRRHKAADTGGLNNDQLTWNEPN